MQDLTPPTGEHSMQTIKASEFKAKCLALMDEVARTGKTMVVTKNGKPVAELRAYTGKRPKSPIGLHKGLIRIDGDIVSPLDLEWEALR
jgi:antitoxin (DNA-binding transcriptional repressor) of toxin-antitoxin stability system